MKSLQISGSVVLTSGWNCCSVREWQYWQLSPLSHLEGSPHSSACFTLGQGVDLGKKKWCPEHVFIYFLAEVSNNFPLNLRVFDSGTYKVANSERLWLFGKSLTERWASRIPSIFCHYIYSQSSKAHQLSTLHHCTKIHQNLWKNHSVWEFCKMM